MEKNIFGKREYRSYRTDVDNRFGRRDALFAMDIWNTLDDIEARVDGLYHKITDFTVNKLGLVDSEKIKDVVEQMMSKYDGFKNKKERKFYSAFLYCSLVIKSLKFDYQETPDYCSSNVIGNFMSFIQDVDEMLVHNGQRTCGPRINEKVKGWGISEFSYLRQCEFLYHLLSGKTIEINKVHDDFRDIEMSPEEFDDMMWKDYEEFKKNGGSPSTEQTWYEEEGLTEEETPNWVDEKNNIEAKRVKISYPGYKDYVKKLEEFNELIDECVTEKFPQVIKKMVFSFLIEGGYSLFKDEDAMVEVMVLMKRIKKAINKAIY